MRRKGVGAESRDPDRRGRPVGPGVINAGRQGVGDIDGVGGLVGRRPSGKHRGVPKPIDPQLLRTVDLVITLGRDATVEVPTASSCATGPPMNPPNAASTGIERMRLVRDNINARIEAPDRRTANWPQLTAARDGSLTRV